MRDSIPGPLLPCTLQLCLFLLASTPCAASLAPLLLQGAMGCAAGVVAINIIRDLLKARPDTNVLFVCGENCTAGSYRGEDPM